MVKWWCPTARSTEASTEALTNTLDFLGGSAKTCREFSHKMTGINMTENS